MLPQEMLQVLMHSNNPAAMVQQMLGNNPMFQRAMQMGQGKSEDEIKQIVKNLASQRGMDINQLNMMLSQFNMKL